MKLCEKMLAVRAMFAVNKFTWFTPQAVAKRTGLSLSWVGNELREMERAGHLLAANACISGRERMPRVLYKKKGMC